MADSVLDQILDNPIRQWAWTIDQRRGVSQQAKIRDGLDKIADNLADKEDDEDNGSINFVSAQLAP